MLELLFLLFPISEPVIECPAGCYPHTNLDLWGQYYQIRNFDTTKDKLIINNIPLDVISTGRFIDFQVNFKWLT